MTPNSQFFLIGPLVSTYNKLMQRASMWLKLCGHQAVGRKLNKVLKMHVFCVFSTLLSLH